MNIFLKIIGKEEIKHFKPRKQCCNPPKKSITKPKSLLIELPKKVRKRKFGKEIQNLGNLTELNDINFNQKKRYRNRKDIILVTKMNKLIKNENFGSKENFGINNDNKNNSMLIEDKNKTGLDKNELDENKENIQSLNEPINIKKDNNNNFNINFQKVNVIQIKVTKNKTLNSNNTNNIVNQNINENVISKDQVAKDNIVIKNIEEPKNELKIIKVNIFHNKNIAEDKNKKIRYNLQRAKEYLEEIHKNLKLIESKGISLFNYMSLIQTDINEKMRIILINWLTEVHFKFHLKNETLFICINIMDRYLSQKNINRKYFQLLGITSLFIACKYEEIYPPKSKDLITMTDNAYQIEEMIKMENEILGLLEFDLTFPTSLRFLEIYGEFLNLDEINFFRCYYLNEVSLICYNLCGYCPSLIACACLYINLKSNLRLFKGYNEEELFKITGYEKTEINSCLNILINGLMKMEEPNNKFISIKKKYALDKYMKVSNEQYLIETD